MLENIRGLPNNNTEAVNRTCSAKKAPLKIPQNRQKQNPGTGFLLHANLTTPKNTPFTEYLRWLPASNSQYSKQKQLFDLVESKRLTKELKMSQISVLNGEHLMDYSFLIFLQLYALKTYSKIQALLPHKDILHK